MFRFFMAAAGLLFSVFSTLAQLVCAVDTVDFGLIRETDGPKTVSFFVRNAGSSPAGILKVRPTCGCTAVEFAKEMVAPGDSARIDLTYNPYRRPGRFEKAVKVFPLEGEMFRVPITGTVLSSPETIGAMFPADGGLLHLSETRFATLTPLGREPKTLFADAYNSGDSPVYVSLESSAPAVEAECFPPVVPPGEKGVIAIYVNPFRETDKGRKEYEILLHTAPSPELLPSSPPVSLTLSTLLQ